LQKTSDKELKEFLNNVHLANNFRKYGWLLFGLVFIISKLLKIYPISWPVICSLFLMLVITLIYDYLVEKTGSSKNIKQANAFYFIFQATELLIVLAIMHISGVAPLMGTFILADYLFTAYFIYSQKKYYWSIISLSVIGYVILITLEYSGVLFVGDNLKIGVPITGNRGIFVIGLIPNLAFLTFLFLLITFFANKLKKSVIGLTKKEEELSEAKEVLEIKVKARTQELEQEKVSLEQRVRERTKALQNKINELEKFQNLSVGRELKMVELKEETELLKKELEKLRNSKI